VAADITKKFDKLVLRRFRPSQGTVGVVPTQSGTYILIPKPCIEIGPRGGCVTSHVGNKRRWSEMEKQFFTSQTNMTPEEVKAYVKDQTGMNATTVMDYSPLLTTNGPASMPKPYEGPGAASSETSANQRRETDIIAFKQLVRTLRVKTQYEVGWKLEAATSDMSRARENLDILGDTLRRRAEIAQTRLERYVSAEKAHEYTRDLMRPYYEDAAALELAYALSEGPFAGGEKDGLALIDEKMAPKTQKQREFLEKAQSLRRRLTNLYGSLHTEPRLIQPGYITNLASDVRELLMEVTTQDMGLGKWEGEVCDGLVRDFVGLSKAYHYIRKADDLVQRAAPAELEGVAYKVKGRADRLAQLLTARILKETRDIVTLKKGPDALDYAARGVTSLFEMAKAQFESIPGITPEKAEKYASRATTPAASRVAAALARETLTLLDGSGFVVNVNLEPLTETLEKIAPNTGLTENLLTISDSLDYILPGLDQGKPDVIGLSHALRQLEYMEGMNKIGGVSEDPNLVPRLWLAESFLAEAVPMLDKIVR